MAPLTCPVCAAPVRQGDLICINCGANLARREAPAAPQQPGGYQPQDQGQSSYPQQQYPPQQDQQQQSYGAPQQQPYGGPQQDYQQQPGYGAPQQQYPPQDQQQSYGAPQDSSPYGAPPQQDQPGYGAPQQQGYGAPQDQQRNASYPPAQGQPQYGAPQQQEQSPYGAPQQQDQSPYGAPQQQDQPGYGAPQQSEQSPYGAPPQHDQQQPYGAPQQQYAPPQQQGYGGGGYGAPGAPHVPPPPREPTMTGGESTAAFTPFCPHCGADIPDIGNPVCVSCLRPLHDQAGGPGQQQLTVFIQFSSGELQCGAGQELVLGRDPVQSPVASSFSRFDNVSRRHATVGIDGNGQPWVRDERSTNGTFVNDRRLQPGEQAPIRDGDSIRLAADARGQVRFGR
jgi:hypothetical protein